MRGLGRGQPCQVLGSRLPPGTAVPVSVLCHGSGGKLAQCAWMTAAPPALCPHGVEVGCCPGGRFPSSYVLGHCQQSQKGLGGASACRVLWDMVKMPFQVRKARFTMAPVKSTKCSGAETPLVAMLVKLVCSDCCCSCRPGEAGSCPAVEETCLCLLSAGSLRDRLLLCSHFCWPGCLQSECPPVSLSS